MTNGFGLFCVPALMVAQVSLASVEDAEADIRGIVEQFRVSIINQDTEVFSSLFLNEDIPFVAVFSKEMLAKKRIDKPDYPAIIDFSDFGSPVKMLSGDETQEEKMSNIKVHTDGYLASVHFDYKDYEGGQQRSYGTELWSLIKVGGDWKITSVTFSVTELESWESTTK